MLRTKVVKKTMKHFLCASPTVLRLITSLYPRVEDPEAMTLRVRRNCCVMRNFFISLQNEKFCDRRKWKLNQRG